MEPLSEEKRLKLFLASARSILEHDDHRDTMFISQALNESWQTYAKGIHVEDLPTNAQLAILTMQKNYKGFNPFTESKTGIVQGSASGQIPNIKEPKFKELDSKNDLIKRKAKNGLETTPTIPGTEKTKTKLESLSRQDPALLENVAKITRHVRKTVSEHTKKQITGARFNLLVKEGDEIAKTPDRFTLAEAVADAEELLLFHAAQDVRMVIEYNTTRGKGKVFVNMLSVTPRGPIMIEGKTIFRFQRSAQLFSNMLVREGIDSKIQRHPWGFQVKSAGNARAISESFKRMIW